MSEERFGTPPLRWERDTMIEIRSAAVSDADIVTQVCDQAWKGVWQGDRQMFVNRMTAFPECGIVVGEIDGKIEGYISAQLSDEANIIRPTWDESTDCGHLTRSHNPDGEWLHGVGLALTPAGSKAGLAGELVRFLYGYIIANGKRGGRFVTRMPGYYRFQDNLSPAQYALALRNGKPLDPELRVLGNCGLRVVDPPVIFQDYVEGGGDPRSCGYSVLVEILNPFYGKRSESTS